MEQMRYPSLQAVIQYMEANKRLELVRRCPSLKFLDRATPLKIRVLSLSPNHIGINGTYYSIGVIRKFSENEKILKEFERENENGVGDLDIYGKRDSSINKILLPGDIPLESCLGVEPERTPEEEDEYMEMVIRRLAYLKTLKRIKERQDEKERIEVMLYTWRLRKSGMKAPYSMYLQFKDGNKVEYLEYNKKVYEAMKYFNESIFGGRKYPITVRYLEIGCYGGVLRLPESVKFRFQDIQIGSNVRSIMNSINGILEKNDSIRMLVISKGINFLENYQDPIVKSAKKLLLFDIETTRDQFPIVLNQSKSLVYVSKGKMTKEEYLRVIDTWIEEKKPSGIGGLFGIHSKKMAEELLKEIEERPGVTIKTPIHFVCDRFPNEYCIPIDERTEISVRCSREIGYDANKGLQEPWKLYFLVRRRQ